MFRCQSLASILCLATAASSVQASEIFKSVDANGHVVYSDHVDASMTRPTMVQLEDARYPPHELHFCSTDCFTLILDNGVYRRVDGTDETWTVETFSEDAIVLHRHDAPVPSNGHSSDVVYAGRVANDRLIAVTVDGKAVSGVDASWGSALNTLPANNAERDAPAKADSTLPVSAGNGAAAVPPPPPVDEEDQPELPQDGYLWTPGYWHWRRAGYFWVPGAWVLPPRFGLLWTPAFWARAGAVYVFHPGYWGPSVGFYGDINYGHGYFGNGYTGGHWIGNAFAYNTTLNHVNPTVAQHAFSGAAGVTSVRQPISPNQTPGRAANKPATTIVQRSTASVPVITEGSRPAVVVRTPSPSAPARISHATATRPAAASSSPSRGR